MLSLPAKRIYRQSFILMVAVKEPIVLMPATGLQSATAVSVSTGVQNNFLMNLTKIPIGMASQQVLLEIKI